MYFQKLRKIFRIQILRIISLITKFKTINKTGTYQASYMKTYAENQKALEENLKDSFKAGEIFVLYE